jgi:hypothetical protein
MTALMRARRRVFHTRKCEVEVVDGLTRTAAVSATIVAGDFIDNAWPMDGTKFERGVDRSQPKREGSLLIGCAKVEILVQSCGN